MAEKDELVAKKDERIEELVEEKLH